MVGIKERRRFMIRLAKVLAGCGLLSFRHQAIAATKVSTGAREVRMQLPPPNAGGAVSVEQAIQQRRTVRDFLPKALHLQQLSQLLWAAAGITEPGGFKRAAPSAGALYPMDLFAVAGKGGVGQLTAGIYHYQAGAHMLSLCQEGDLRDAVVRACLSQVWMARAPVNLLITAEYNRTAGKYGDRGVRYAMIEAGHMGQNLFLQAEAMGLGVGIVGAFRDRELIDVLHLPAGHEPLLVLPVGYQA